MNKWMLCIYIFHTCVTLGFRSFKRPTSLMASAHNPVFFFCSIIINIINIIFKSKADVKEILNLNQKCKCSGQWKRSRWIRGPQVAIFHPPLLRWHWAQHFILTWFGGAVPRPTMGCHWVTSRSERARDAPVLSRNCLTVPLNLFKPPSSFFVFLLIQMQRLLPFLLIFVLFVCLFCWEV